MRRHLFPLLVFLLCTSLTACYTPTIVQGNKLTQANISRIKTGMSVKQVTDILGDPLLRNIYNDHRIAYVYSCKTDKDALQVKRVIIEFSNGKVTQVQQST